MIRAPDALARPPPRRGAPSRFGVRLGGLGPGGRRAPPLPRPAARDRAGHRVAVELELTAKAPARREEILAGYAADPRIDAVLYLVDRPSVGRGDRPVGGGVGISDLVHVQHVSFPAHRAQPATLPRIQQRLPSAGQGANTAAAGGEPSRRRPAGRRTGRCWRSRCCWRSRSAGRLAGLVAALAVTTLVGLAPAGPRRSRAAATADRERRDGAVVLGATSAGARCVLSDRQLAAHGLIVGASGAGKSTTLLAILERPDPTRAAGGGHRPEGLAGVRRRAASGRPRPPGGRFGRGRRTARATGIRWPTATPPSSRTS